jgi:hypothetical protein
MILFAIDCCCINSKVEGGHGILACVQRWRPKNMSYIETQVIICIVRMSCKNNNSWLFVFVNSD